MKKLLFVFITLIASYAAFAQQKELVFEIQPYVVERKITTPDTTFIIGSDTCTSIALSIAGADADSAAIAYKLMRPNGSQFEADVKKIPVQTLSIVISKPINITNLNAILNFWHLKAIRQLTPGEEN